MTSTADEFMATLRSQADARARGVAAPALALSADDHVAAVAEISTDRQDASDLRLVNEWLSSDDTRTAAVTGGDLVLAIDATPEHTITRDGDGKPVFDDTLRAAITAQIS